MSIKTWALFFVTIIAQTVLSDDTNECGYFIYDNTPFPLHICQSLGKSSIEYYCESDNEGVEYISYNIWDNDNCEYSPNDDKASSFDPSDTRIYNCGSDKSAETSCNLAYIDIWTNSYCFNDPYFQLIYVVDICIVDETNTYSTYWTCNDNGLMIENIYNNLYCNGTIVSNNIINSNITQIDSNYTSNNNCFAMQCHNHTYYSYHERKQNKSDSFWDNPRAPEILFIVATSILIVGFFVCYFYRQFVKRKTVKKDKVNIQLENNNENYGEFVEDDGNENINNGRKNEFEEEEIDLNDNKLISTAITSDDKNSKLLDVVTNENDQT